MNNVIYHFNDLFNLTKSSDDLNELRLAYLSLQDLPALPDSVIEILIAYVDHKGGN